MSENTNTNNETLGELTPKELAMIAAVRDGDNRLANVLMEQMSPPSWTYERRLALYVIGAMGLEYPSLDDDVFTDYSSPSGLHRLIDVAADALISGMHTLGCPEHLTLAQILSYASDAPDPEEKS